MRKSSFIIIKFSYNYIVCICYYKLQNKEENACKYTSQSFCLNSTNMNKT